VEDLCQIVLIAIPGIPLIHVGDDLASTLLDCAARGGIEFQDGDVLVVTQKVVSKAEGCMVGLDRVNPSDNALVLAEATGRDARAIEVILQESREVLRSRRGVIITEHRLGWVCANAGVDRSNVAPPGDDVVLCLPKDPDRSAREIRARLCEATGSDISVVISDTQGRPFRSGAVGVAVGVAGMPAMADLRGRSDLYGYELRTTQVAIADQLASAANLLMGQADEGRPAVLIRGAAHSGEEQEARDLQRPPELDLFR
jgi:coenzyme F420-0:L-glutamate ligase/coenzyme F420-1:gamma-L-glutamate ligase